LNNDEQNFLKLPFHGFKNIENKKSTCCENSNVTPPPTPHTLGKPKQDQ